MLRYIVKIKSTSPSFSCWLNKHFNIYPYLPLPKPQMKQKKRNVNLPAYLSKNVFLQKLKQIFMFGWNFNYWKSIKCRSYIFRAITSSLWSMGQGHELMSHEDTEFFFVLFIYKQPNSVHMTISRNSLKTHAYDNWAKDTNWWTRGTWDKHKFNEQILIIKNDHIIALRIVWKGL